MARLGSLLALPLLLSACSGDVETQDGSGGAGGASGTTGSSTVTSTVTVGPSSSNSVTVVSSSSTGMPSDILDQLNAVPGMSVEELPSQYPGYRYFTGTFEQPADHADPNGLKFEQRVQILHSDPALPMVLFTTGYGLFGDAYLSEPALIAGANQISVEHRFFPPSRPEPADWQKLTIEQAATDHHRIVEGLSPIYAASWLSTGGSKGGMTSVYHRRFYPSDIDGTIAYVAPHSYGLGDPRYVDFLEQVGDPACRDALKAFQIEALTRRNALVPMIEQLGGSFSYWGEDAALDFAVSGIRFAIWQYGDDSACDFIPDAAASDDDIFAYLDAYNSVWGTVDENILFFEPYYFQAATQLGDPAIDESYLAALMTVPAGMNAADFVIPGPTKDTIFQPGAMPDIQDWVLDEGTELLFVYGENDPWTAAAFEISATGDQHLYVAPAGNHGAGIDSLLGPDANAATNAVLQWAGRMTEAPPAPSAADLEIARLVRLADGVPPGKRRAAYEQRIREIVASRP